MPSTRQDAVRRWAWWGLAVVVAATTLLGAAHMFRYMPYASNGLAWDRWAQGMCIWAPGSTGGGLVPLCPAAAQAAREAAAQDSAGACAYIRAVPEPTDTSSAAARLYAVRKQRCNGGRP